MTTFSPMKIFSLIALTALPLFGQDTTGGAAPKPGSSSSGYPATIYNKDYSKGFLGEDANPTDELEAMYPQSSYTLNPEGGGAGRTGPDFMGAKSQAVYWLSLIDQKAYGASWSQAGGLLQDLVGRNIWIAAMEKIRAGLGNNQSRKVSNHNLINRLPHGTKGKFMVITFDSSYSGRSKVQEKVILSAEGSRGQWKVISYSINK